jgi:hypothetical protein
MVSTVLRRVREIAARARRINWPGVCRPPNYMQNWMALPIRVVHAALYSAKVK